MEPQHYLILSAVLFALGAFGVLAFGLFFMGLSWFVTGVNFVVTVHHGRREGLGFFDMPLTSWGFYLYGYLLVVSGSVFAVILLVRVFTLGVPDASMPAIEICSDRLAAG